MYRFKDVPEYDGGYHLFYGKLLLHQGKFAEAEEEFAKLGESGGDGVLAFDGQSRLGEAGRVYAAIAKSRQGKVEEARSVFDAMLALPDTTPASRQWIEQLKLELAAAAPPDAGVKNRPTRKRPE